MRPRCCRERQWDCRHDGTEALHLVRVGAGLFLAPTLADREPGGTLCIDTEVELLLRAGGDAKLRERRRRATLRAGAEPIEERW